MYRFQTMKKPLGKKVMCSDSPQATTEEHSALKIGGEGSIVDSEARAPETVRCHRPLPKKFPENN